MRIKLIQLITIGLALLSASSCSAIHPELKAYHEARKGMERLVIVLPPKEQVEEDGLKVELIPGKTMLTDNVNRVRLGTRLRSRPLKGWGYNYYEVAGNDVVMGTMMAVPEGAQKTEKFVQGKPLFVRYNSRLPIVIYVPTGYDIQYRIWNASVTQTAVRE